MSKRRVGIRRAVRTYVVAVLLVVVLGLPGCFQRGPDVSGPLLDEDGRPLAEALRLVKVVEGLEQPVFMAEVPDGSGRLFLVEQRGTVRSVADGRLGDVVLDLRDRVRSGGEQGLLGLAFHPEYPDDGRMFVHYSADPGGDTVVSSFRATEDGTFDAAKERVVLEVGQPYSNHNGGMIAFGPDGMLYVGLGDGGAGGDPEANAQDKQALLGKILRLDVSPAEGYDIPPDNPFVGREGADEVWVYGLRNPWRFSFDRDNGDLWIGDVGQNAWEEIDWLPEGEQAGANLGWDAYEGTHRFEDKSVGDVVMPVAEYALQSPHNAVTGGYRYRGTDIPALGGVYLFADFGSGWVWGLDRHEGEWAMGRLFTSNRHVSSFAEDLDGELYLVDHGGALMRFVQDA